MSGTPSVIQRGVVITPRIAFELERATDISRLRAARAQGNDRHLAAVLCSMHELAVEYASTLGVPTGPLPAPEPDSPWLTPLQVAKRLNLTDHRIRQVIRQGELPAERVGRMWRVSVEAFEDYRALRRAQ